MHQNNDIQTLRRLLSEIKDWAEHASLTGSMTGSRPAAIRRYNTSLARLEEMGASAARLFSPLPESASLDEVGFEAGLLASTLKDESAALEGRAPVERDLLIRLAPFANSRDLAELVRNYMRGSSRVDADILCHLAPFLGEEGLGEMLGEFLRRQEEPVVAESHVPIKNAAPAATGPVEEPTGLETAPSRTRSDAEDVIVLAEIERITQELLRPNLSPEERKVLALELAESTTRKASLPS